MALSFLIIIIREGKGESTRREEGKNVLFFYYRVPRVINSRHFLQLLLCCWRDEWHRHQHAARLQEHGHGLQGMPEHPHRMRLAEVCRGPAITGQVHFPGDSY